jgi:long-chain acyl-CoA synthetase
MSTYPWYDVAPITDLRDMLRKSAEKFGGKDAFLVKSGEGYAGITYAEFSRRVSALGAALFARGFAAGQALSAYSEGRWEWPLAYLACAGGGGVNVPIDKDLREAEVRHILDRTRVAVVVTSARFLDIVLEIRPKLPHLQTVICMDPTDRPGVVPLADLLREGQELVNRNRTGYPQVAIDPEAPAAVIYTSGTMGSSKGVVLSHRNIATNMMDMNAAVYIDEHDIFLSVLPLHHTYECTCGMLTPLYRGCTIVYCENLRRLADQLKEVRATMMLGVPLLFENIYRKVQDGIKEKGRGKFAVAKGLAGLSQRFLGLDLRKKIFHALHERFGGRLRLLISGGAAVDPAVAKFFRELGIAFLQGYGMTECAPIIAVNRNKQFKDSAAGLPLPSMEVRIEDGEICARGPSVMLGYFEDPEATAEAVVDGWMHTGDLGYFDEEGFLHIQGRKKAVIVLKNGKNVYPEEVEYYLNGSPFILESLVWEGPEATGGEVEEVHAILVPDLEKVDQHFQQQGVPLSDERVEELLKREVRRQCLRLSHYKRVRRFTIRWEEFDKTTTRKIKRYLYTEKIKKI